MEDSLRRDDLRPAPPSVPVKTQMKVMWHVLFCDGSGHATQRLYTRKQALRFVRLARLWGHDVYTASGGKVRVPAS